MEKTELYFQNQPARLSLVEGGRRRAEVLSRPGLPVSQVERFCEDWLSEAEYLLQSPPP